MKNKKGFTLVELMAVIVVLAIIIAIAVPSYAKIKKNIEEKNYKNKVNLIEIAAEKYSEDTHYETVFVEDLIKAGYLDADDVNGIIYNDLKTDQNGNKESLNCHVVKSENKNGIYYGKLLEDTQFVDESGNCIRNDLNEINGYVSIKMYEETNGKQITNETKYWTKDDVVLEAELSEELQGAEIKWYKGYSQTPFASYNEITVESGSVLQENYTVEASLGDKTFNASARVYIDKIKPKFYENDAKTLNSKWVTKIKYGIKAYDNESGIYGYYFEKAENDSKCSNDISMYRSNKNKTIKENGKYLVCLMDNVGNFDGKIIELNHIDPATMKCKITVSSGIKGNVVNNNQWYIGNSIGLKVEPYSNENVGPSGVSLGISTNNKPSYNTGYILKENSPQYITTITSNQNAKTYYGYVKNQAGTSNSCNTKVYYEKSITKPVLASTTNSYDNITATYKDENAISGIKETKCYLTDVTGTVIKEGTVEGLKCKFNVTATKNNTLYYFKRCIKSNAGNSICSIVNSKSNIGYCNSGHYTWTGTDMKITHDIYLNDGSVPTNIDWYTTYCRSGYYKSVYKDIRCSDTTTQYCSSGYGTGTCSNVYTSITSCSMLDFRAGGGVEDYEISTNMPDYFSKTNRPDLGNWHVANFQHCVNGTEQSNGYPCLNIDGSGSRYRKDSVGNIHEWYTKIENVE